MDLVYRLECETSSGAIRRLYLGSITTMHPLFVYDGDCTFCRFWLQRWQRRTGRTVSYEPFQKVAEQFPYVPEAEFARAAKLVTPEGRMHSGAAAVFRLWTYRSRAGHLWWWSYRHVPLFAPVSEGIYRTIARNRSFFWSLTRMLFPLSTRRFEEAKK